MRCLLSSGVVGLSELVGAADRGPRSRWMALVTVLGARRGGLPRRSRECQLVFFGCQHRAGRQSPVSALVPGLDVAHNPTVRSNT